MARGYRKNIKGGSDYGEGTEPPQTVGYANGATNPQEDAANSGSADNEKLNELNNLQNGGKRRRHYQRGGNNNVKAVEVDSPARETAAGPYTAQNQVMSNQEASNQGMADTEYDNPGPQNGGKRRRKRTRRTKRKSKKGNKKTVKKSRSKRSRKHR